MNTSKIKAYAPRARQEFIQAVSERANVFGIFDDQNIEPLEISGDVALIGGRAFSKEEGELREKLVCRVRREGFSQLMEACAYTWFNRFVAIRYMELHDFLGHGFRVVSNPGGSDIPEILENAADLEFDGLKKEKVIELRLAGDRDNELYRLLIVAQCNALHKAMPFLFDRIDSETRLLLPDSLLHSNSPIRRLVNDIDEDSWQEVEIIGWIYQFYISEKKDQVIGKVVRSEDIPAATQLFTPNWIVKYMVQNTLGRMWLATYPDSDLKDKMEYYIEPAEQKPEVQAELDRITPNELNPEDITFLDPACGSGHILIEAYAIFKEIYLERGYRTRDIPKLILEKNIFGLDICDRAAQLACFAVLMKAREDDRRILGRGDLKLNVMAIQESDESDVKDIEIFFGDDEDVREGLKAIVDLFNDAKTFGSLLAIPENLVGKKEIFETAIEKNIEELFRIGNADRLKSLLLQTEILERKYDCVITNPPYMGGKGMNPNLRTFTKKHFPASKSDLFAIFVERNPSCGWRYTASAADFKKIPGSPIAYWVGGKLLEIFSDNKCMQDFAKATGGMTTGNTSQYLRRWNEVNYCNIGQNLISREMAVESGLKWFPYNKGGTFRKWYGNHEYVVNWLNDGEDIINSGKSFPRSKNYYFKESISWSDVTSSHNSFRYYPNGFIFDVSAPSAFFNNKNCLYISLSLLNNKFSKLATKLINPTLHFNTGEFAILPYPELLPDKIIINLVKQAVNISQNDWNNNETSWEFLTIPLLQSNQKQQTLKKLFTIIRKNWNNAVLEMQRLEQENNRIFIEAYGLEEELTPEVPLKEITLTCNPHYRYGGNKSEEELETLLQTDTIKELISYAIGCMMGRYSLDHPGLIYAHSGNIDFDPSKYKTFPADDDGIIPIMDQEWFPDDATKRFLEFLKAAWTPETLEENLKFVADSLKPKTNESPVDTIRRYISTGFFKDHLRTYKKRPIYWLFSSGKQKAFQCLVYLHRYKESTLSRMRSAYVTPLQGHLTARIEFLQNEKDSAKTASARRKVQKTIERIRKKQAELRQFDDELRHYADMKISLDLDDGVKVNYGKFGSLLAESKAVTGKKK
ncbi:MAG: hypothetical protein B6245_08240 [Desulfobacteraceae bacterium 4572_88]|nr:MAG: hypothetical protein B6245_08240 [Desulfobacteraceae bacterium 4572_88]